VYQFASLRAILILLLAGLSTYLTFKKAKFGVIIFVFLLLLRDSFLRIWFPPAYDVLHLPRYFAVLTFMSYLFHKREKFYLPSQLWLIFILFIIICLSRFFSGTGIFNNKVPGEYLKICIITFLITNTIKTERDLRQIIISIMIINAFSALYHYYLYRVGSWRSVYIVKSYYLDRNYFAGTLAATSALAYFTFQSDQSSKHLKILSFFCFISFIGGVILTESRSGFLTLSVVLLACVLLDKRRLRIVVPLSIVLALLFLRVSGSYFDRLSTIVNYESDTSAMGRIATNKAAINMMKSHPLLGIGAGNFNYFFLDYTPDELKQWVRPGKSIHNIFLQTGSETGLIGLTIFTLIIVSSLIDVIRLRKRCLKDDSLKPLGYKISALGVALLGLMVELQFIPGAYYSYIYILIPLIAAAKPILHNMKSLSPKVEEVRRGETALGGLSEVIVGYIVRRQIKQVRKGFVGNETI